MASKLPYHHRRDDRPARDVPEAANLDRSLVKEMDGALHDRVDGSESVDLNSLLSDHSDWMHRKALDCVDLSEVDLLLREFQEVLPWDRLNVPDGV